MSGSKSGEGEERNVAEAVKGLAKGLGVTARNLARPPVTTEYPQQVPDVPDGFRGLPVLLSFPGTETLKCTACELCARACPVDCITIQWTRVDRRTTDPHAVGNNTQTGRRLDVYNLDASLCLYCGLCAEACPWEALAMSDYYEMSAPAARQGEPVPHNPEATGGYPGRHAGDGAFVYDKFQLGELARRPQVRVTGMKFNPYLAVGGLNVPPPFFDADFLDALDERLEQTGAYRETPKLREVVRSRRGGPAPSPGSGTRTSEA